MYFFRKLTQFFTSMHLAVVLLALLGILSAFSTFIPQGEAAVYYTSRYGIFSGPLLTLGFHRFFSSALFVGIVALFSINLISCLLYRFIKTRNFRSISARGADVVHIGILMLIAAGLLTVFLRSEDRMIFAPGETAVLPGGYRITLESLETIRYQEGQVKEWISKLILSKGSKEPVHRDVKVNAPLRIGYLRIYQYSAAEEPVIRLVSAEAERMVSLRDRIGIEGGTVEFTDIDPDKGSATMVVSQNDELKSYNLTEGSRVWQFEVAAIGKRPLSVLMAVYDPGFFPAVVSFIFILIGLCLVFYRRIILPIKENEL